MCGLDLHLLGPPMILCNGFPLRFSRKKVLACLAYLAVATVPKSRDFLTHLFFPELDREHARSDFRQILSILKHKIGSEHLAVENGLISLLKSENLHVDVLSFRRQVRAYRGLAEGPELRASAQAMERTAYLYRGVFLCGFYLKRNYDFENWQLTEQENLHRDYLHILRTLTSLYAGLGKLDSALYHGRKWAELDPLDERAHRSIMKLYAAAHQPAAALRQFESCRESIRKELDSEPSAETLRLFHAIRGFTHHDGLRPPAGAAVRPPGRRKGLTRGEKALLTFSKEPGAGKSRLADGAISRMLDTFPDKVYFVDLATIGRAAEIVPAIAHALQISAALEKKAGLIDLVERHINNQQMLLVLSNVEHLPSFSRHLAGLLAHCPNLRILAAGRKAPRLESARALPPKDVPTSPRAPRRRR